MTLQAETTLTTALILQAMQRAISQTATRVPYPPTKALIVQVSQRVILQTAPGHTYQQG